MIRNDQKQLIRNIWAVGRNYGAHAKELGNAVPTPESEPLVFLKAGSTAVENENAFSLRAKEGEVHFECELAFRFGKDLRFDGVTLALDLTARDLQTKVKKEGKPWTIAKSFKDSCPLGRIVPLPPGDLQTLRFTLHVNGELRQRGDARDMIHPIEKLRLYVLENFPVCPGDLLLTGTPEGVGALLPGDEVEADIEGVLSVAWRVN